VRAWLRTEPDHASRNPAFLRVFFLWLMEPEEATTFLENEALVHEAKLLEFREIASGRKRQDGEALAFGLALSGGSGTSKGSSSGTSGLVARSHPGRLAAPDESTPDRGRLCHARGTRRVNRRRRFLGSMGMAASHRPTSPEDSKRAQARCRIT
jgi:hypothetical protein